MGEDRLDLRSLAEVGSPDVVRGALREFRRRVLTKYLWIALALAAVIAGAFLYPPERTLVDRIEEADDVALVGYSEQVGGATWTLIRVADLGDTLGLEWLVFPLDAKGGLSFPVVSVGAARSGEGTGELVSFEIETPASGIVRGTLRVPGSGSEAYELDLRAVGVPPRFWDGS